jgi:hypothetical protein
MNQWLTTINYDDPCEKVRSDNVGAPQRDQQEHYKRNRSRRSQSEKLGQFRHMNEHLGRNGGTHPSGKNVGQGIHLGAALEVEAKDAKSPEPRRKAAHQ